MKKTDAAEKDFFWRKDEKLKKIKILNPDDFRYPEIDGIGKEFNGLADKDEILARNSLMSFLFDRPVLRSQIKACLSIQRQYPSLPDEETEFLAFYEKENPYWELVHSIIAKLEKEKEALPERLKTFLQDLHKSLPLAEKEAEMSKRIVSQLKKTTRMDGVMEMYLNGSHGGSAIMGQKAFNSAWSPKYVATIPKFLKNGFFRFLGITQLTQTIANYRAKNQAKKSAIIESLPSSILSDIEVGLRKLLITPDNLEELAEAMKISDEELESFKYERTEKLYQDFQWWKDNKAYCGLKFKYDQQGLQIIPLYLSRSSKSETDFNLGDYNAFSIKEKTKFRKLAADYNWKAGKALGLSQLQKYIAELEEKTNFRINATYLFESPYTDKNFRWIFLQNLYNTPENIFTYHDLVNNRRFLTRRLRELADMCGIIENMVSYAKRKMMPICMPKPSSDGTGISFRNLAPLDILDHETKLVPFSFPRINGHLICLTGRHGGGKSVSGNSVLQAVWLAQSGFPVFAESFEFDLKDVIGSITNDTGEGSTITKFLKKCINLFANIEKVSTHKSLIFIDEMGKGTQDASMMNIGSQILHTISKKGYSAIFNTQIMDLARYAEKDLGAICLKVDKNHQFKSGIGEGELENLVKEYGLDKYLVKN